MISHCPSGGAFEQALDVLEGAGRPGRFVQVHAHAEADFELHLRALRRGAWLEYDAIGGRPDALFVDLGGASWTPASPTACCSPRTSSAGGRGPAGATATTPASPSGATPTCSRTSSPPCVPRGGRGHRAPADRGESAGPPRPRLTPPDPRLRRLSPTPYPCVQFASGTLHVLWRPPWGAFRRDWRPCEAPYGLEGGRCGWEVWCPIGPGESPLAACWRRSSCSWP